MADKGTIDQILQASVRDGEVPGVVAVAADDSGVIYQGAFGRRSVASDAPMTLDTVFRIASMTKAITGTAAMQMVEQGKLSLDQPAGEVVPELAESAGAGRLQRRRSSRACGRHAARSHCGIC